MKWRLIASAPMDGTAVLLACKDWPYIIVGHWLKRSDNLERWGDRIHKTPPPSEPTHWMPLPNWPREWQADAAD